MHRFGFSDNRVRSSSIDELLSGERSKRPRIRQKRVSSFSGSSVQRSRSITSRGGSFSFREEDKKKRNIELLESSIVDKIIESSIEEQINEYCDVTEMPSVYQIVQEIKVILSLGPGPVAISQPKPQWGETGCALSAF